jgi:serine/threonine protein phosphatase PrpC
MMPARMLSAVHTVAGRRSSNQDAVTSVTLIDGRQLVAVADGMGGHRGGEIASKRALEALVAGLQGGDSLADAVKKANRVVHAAAQDNADLAGMGTTIVALLRSEDRYHIANVGDSRAYRVTPSAVFQITRDHSVTAEAIASGHITPEEAKNSRWKNALTRAIGTDAEIDVDIFGPFDAAQPHRVLLCTDGLHGSISQPTIQQHLNKGVDVSKAAERLADEAFRNGSSDNISAAVVVFEGERSAAPAQKRAPDPQPARSSANYRVILMPEPNPLKRERSWLSRFFSLFRGAA